VIAIIGILIALLLPAVQAARAAAARSNCASNQKNIALAFHNYNDIYSTLPLGARSYDRGTWALFTLPFIEQEALASRYDHSVTYNSEPNVTLMAERRIGVYSCPADGDQTSSYRTYKHHNFVVCMGHAGLYNIYCGTTGVPSVIPSSWGFAPFGSITSSQVRSGAFWGGRYYESANSFKSYSFNDITDGLSNTIVLSETIQGVPAAGLLTSQKDLRGLIWFGDKAFFTTYYQPNTRSPDIVLSNYMDASKPGGGTLYDVDHPLAAVPTSTYIGILSARSFHAGGVNAVFGDGSVSFRSNSINVDIWRGMGTIDGAEVISH
jgi:prepilin-type processing-associated H-X9-DG protein